MIISDELKTTGSIAVHAKVCAIKDITPHLRRISLRHEILQDVGPLAAGAHLKVFISRTKGTPAVLPELSAGRPYWSDEKNKPYVRTYTVRRLDRVNGILDIEFVLHGDNGLASAWAATASVGDDLGIGIKRMGKVHNPSDWYLLAGDETAIPAISAMLESLPIETTGIAFLEVKSSKDEFTLKNNSSIEICWLFRNGEPPEKSQLLPNAVKGLLLPNALVKSRYAWIAGEENMVRALRKIAGEQLGLKREELHATVYWKAGLSEDDYHLIRTRE